MKYPFAFPPENKYETKAFFEYALQNSQRMPGIRKDWNKAQEFEALRRKENKGDLLPPTVLPPGYATDSVSSKYCIHGQWRTSLVRI